MWRNIREHVASGVAVAFFVSFFVRVHDGLFRVACALLIAGLAYMAYQLHRRTSPRSMPAELGAANSLQFHRTELERQRDFIRHIWRWYLEPLVPGLVMFSVDSVVAHHNSLARLALTNLFFAFCLILVWRLNAYAARCLQRKIEDLAKVAAE